MDNKTKTNEVTDINANINYEEALKNREAQVQDLTQKLEIMNERFTKLFSLYSDLVNKYLEGK